MGCSYNLQKFCKAGILDSTLNVVSCDLDDEDPFLAADESMALQGLIDDGCDHCEWRGWCPSVFGYLFRYLGRRIL